MELPTATVVTRGYDSLARISSVAAGASNALQNASFNFDHVGNLLSRSDAPAALTSETFGYDTLNRVTTVTGATGKTFRYDTLGNLICRSGLPCAPTGCAGATVNMTYTANTHRPAAAGTGAGSWTWSNPDANGNVQAITPSSGSAKTAIYNQFNLPGQLVQGATTMTFAYDGDHARVRETVSGAKARYGRLRQCRAHCLGAVFVLVNRALVVRHLVSAKPTTVIPLLGGALIAIGMLVDRRWSLGSYWFLPLLFGYGSLPLLVMTARAHFIRRR